MRVLGSGASAVAKPGQQGSQVQEGGAQLQLRRGINAYIGVLPTCPADDISQRLEGVVQQGIPVATRVRRAG